MIEHANRENPNPAEGSDPSSGRRGGGADMISPVLYDLVMWGFVEKNSLGQRILRRDIQARLDGNDETAGELNGLEGKPLYVGYRCQACWEAAVTLVTYGQHLCAWDARTVAALPRQPFQ